MSWLEQAACRGMDTEIFFPKLGGYHDVEPIIKAVCDRCPVAQQCLDLAMKQDIQIGYFGGLSARQRDRLISRGYRRIA